MVMIMMVIIVEKYTIIRSFLANIYTVLAWLPDHQNKIKCLFNNIFYMR